MPELSGPLLRPDTLAWPQHTARWTSSIATIRAWSRILPKAEVVSLTGTAFINHTIEDLLSLCRGSYVVLTGPTSPLSPVLFDFGISAICGTRVANAEEVIRFISQAATFKQLHGHGVRLLTMTSKEDAPAA